MREQGCNCMDTLIRNPPKVWNEEQVKEESRHCREGKDERVKGSRDTMEVDIKARPNILQN